MNNNFVALILTHGRPDRVLTFDTLRRQGYTGKIVIVIDNEDKSRGQYIDKFGSENVVVFDKQSIAKTFDQGDNFNDRRAIIYARNASFEIARQLGATYFIQLDDDYKSIDWRFDDKMRYCHRKMSANLDGILQSLLKFFIDSRAHSLAIAQGGDYIGGASSGICFGSGKVGLKRKCMNSFICSIDRPFKFIGRINEDVNTYTHQASKGLLFFTSNQVALEQLQTQSNSGGMTELYLDSGTYIKSFYSVMYQPSSVKVKSMGFTQRRLHHVVKWTNTVPMILSEDVKKKKNVS